MRTAAHRRFRIGGQNVRRALVAAALMAGLTTISTGTSHAVQFCNTAPINGTGAFGPLGLYPSPIVVSGLSGTVTDVNVTLLGLTTQPDPNNLHWVEDLDVMVSGPTGATAVIMSDAGGNNDDVQPGLSNVNLTLDDQAANQLPADSALSSGTWRPVDDDVEHSSETRPVDVWNAPAPAPGGSALSVFNGTNPNGTWNLWAMDDTMLAVNGFNGGWCVDILTTGGGGGTTTVPTTVATTTSSTMSPTTTSSTMFPTTTSTTSSTTTTMGLPVSTCAAPPPATIQAQPGVPVFGTAGNDVIYGTAGNDRIFGQGGNDIIVGMGGDDQLAGGEGNDVLCGGAGNDYLVGEGGSDLLVGDAGNDFLLGDAGNDRLIGGLDADRLSGGSEVDTCTSGGQAGDFSSPPPDCDTIT